MNRIISWTIGLLLGASVAALLVALFAPATSEEIVRRLKGHFNHALQAARQASIERRAELEAEYAAMQTSTAAAPPPRR